MILPYLVYWLGSLADWYTTKRILLDKGGVEINGFVRKIVDLLPWSTEVELFLLKAGLFALMVLTGAEPVVYCILGGVYALAGIGNKYNWWGKLRGLFK